MPLTLMISEGALPRGSEKKALQQITESFVKLHGLTGNSALKHLVTGSFHILPKGTTFQNGEDVTGVWIEWKAPAFALADADILRNHFAEATEIIHNLSNGTLAREKIWSNVVHAVDGSWNFKGQAFSNEQLGQELSKG